MELGLWDIVDAGEGIGEPCLGIDVVEFGGADEGVDESGAFAATIRACEQP